LNGTAPGAGYLQLIEDTEQLVLSTAKMLDYGLKIKYQQQRD